MFFSVVVVSGNVSRSGEMKQCNTRTLHNSNFVVCNGQKIVVNLFNNKIDAFMKQYNTAL